ncbi:PilZ domain-containing protein [Parathalassolituus penaei]|uniref:PilZ domain-containing protein n=1 Tax=Parathalassolituus penaei TaxID=2997323 RepID=A0A9X3ED99_9GAMM|nr:PilZ domain-containing protein [Parathalassolituus penaei]MCY0965444.1 PilZ domain-containing protein [Parathalassolituus penaei]
MNWRQHFTEKRDHVRIKVDTTAVLTMGIKELPMKCLDISASGAKLQYKGVSGLVTGDLGFIEINSAGGTTAPLTASVRICRIQPMGDFEEIGVELTNVR